MPPSARQIPGLPLIDAWERTLSKHRKRRALVDTVESASRTFGELDDTALQLTSQLSGLGEVVAFCAENDPLWIPAFLALVRSGATVVLMEAQASLAPSFQGLIESLNASAIVTIRDGQLQTALAKANRWPEEERPALLKVTSGTGGTPRGICFSADQILADCDNICETMGIHSDDLNYGAISMAHSYGFSNLVTPLICHGVPLVVTNDRLPHSIHDWMIATGATIFPATPIFFQKFNDLGLDSRGGKLRLAISAGAPLPAEVSETFWKTTGHRIHAFYGSSECGGICYDASESGDFISGYVGAPMKGVTLTVDSESGRPEIRGAAVGRRYFPEEATEILSDGRFRPADLLARQGEGYRVVGRVSDLINIAGRKLNPVEVESVLLRHPAVREAVVFGVPNETRGEMPAACVVAGDADEQQLIAHCLQLLPAWQTPKFVKIVPEIPVTARGKISRVDLARRFGT